ncbi:hypothetical protein NXV73_09910 [Bacteroides salyersiae]|nr:hypothetical protein [Bacteroides salyersiae]
MGEGTCNVNFPSRSEIAPIDVPFTITFTPGKVSPSAISDHTLYLAGLICFCHSSERVAPAKLQQQYTAKHF